MTGNGYDVLPDRLGPRVFRTLKALFGKLNNLGDSVHSKTDGAVDIVHHDNPLNDGFALLGSHPGKSS